MRYPWVNVLLLAFVLLALVSGYFGLTNGDPDKAWILWVHGAVAYAILVLLGWKAAVVAGSLRRNRVAGTPRMAFLALATLLLFVLASGLTWANAGRIVFGPVSLIELHQWAAVAVAVLLAWHVVARRWVWGIAPARDRRAFLRLAAGAVAGAALLQATSAFAALTGLPGAKRRFTGSYETGSLTGRFPVVEWLFDAPDRVSPVEWRIEIAGEVETSRQLGLGDLLALPQHSLEATLDCTGGWYTTQAWSGVRIADLLALARPRQGWSSIEVESVTGYSRRFSRSEAEGLLLSLGVAGRPLTHGHGAPARLVVPHHRGFDWVKWVRRISVHNLSDVWQSPLPLQ